MHIHTYIYSTREVLTSRHSQAQDPRFSSEGWRKKASGDAPDPMLVTSFQIVVLFLMALLCHYYFEFHE